MPTHCAIRIGGAGRIRRDETLERDFDLADRPSSTVLLHASDDVWIIRIDHAGVEVQDEGRAAEERP